MTDIVPDSPDPAPAAPAPAADVLPGKPDARQGARPNARRRQAKAAAPAQAAQQAAHPARKAANPVLERLFELYPKMFGARFLPLKLGVYQELLAAHGDEFKKEDLKLAMGQHARSTRYLESVAAGEKRHDLQGLPVEDVAPEHVQHAIFEVFRRRQARSREDLRPWVQARLVAAIDASGLGREAWTERVGTLDEFAAAALDQAFATLGEQAARGEALRRAFEASGRSVEEFAEMYGMDAAVVSRTLARNK